jgi:hypothetical protein
MRRDKLVAEGALDQPELGDKNPHFRSVDKRALEQVSCADHLQILFINAREELYQQVGIGYCAMGLKTDCSRSSIDSFRAVGEEVVKTDATIDKIATGSPTSDTCTSSP